MTTRSRGVPGIFKICDFAAVGCEVVWLRVSGAALEAINLLAPELFFFNFRTSCI